MLINILIGLMLLFGIPFVIFAIFAIITFDLETFINDKRYR